MDPDANLDEQRALAESILEQIDSCADDGTLTAEQLTEIADDANRLAELVQALDGWIVGKGFYPKDWRRKEQP